MILDLAGAVLKGVILGGLIAGGALYVDRASFVGAPLTARLRYVARTRWPYLIIVVAGMTGDMATQLLPEPRGHWSGHAMTAFVQLSVGVALLATCGLARRLGIVLLLAGVVVIGLAIAASGNWRVAESLWKTSYGDEAVGESVALDPSAFTSGHDIAETGEMIAWISGIAFVVLAGLLKKVPARTAFIGGLLAILPPWMFGGIGALFVVARAAAFHLRGEHPPPVPATREPAPAG
ncbi:MAG: hypothetical protein QOD63_988 [Actinomycetota bacterium]|nr:hypothetical protein [Actinomycetota bacterium]